MRRWMYWSLASTILTLVAAVSLHVADSRYPLGDGEAFIDAPLAAVALLGVVAVSQAAAAAREASIFAAAGRSGIMAAAVGGPALLLFPAAVAWLEYRTSMAGDDEAVAFAMSAGGYVLTFLGGIALVGWIGLTAVAWMVAKALPDRWGQPLS